MIILLHSYNTKTLVVVINGVPDLSAYSEPTLSILQAAYDAGHYEIMPEPDPLIQAPSADWNGFYDQLRLSQTYRFLYSNSITHPGIAWAMAAVGLTIERGKDDPTNPDKLAALQTAVSGLLLAAREVGLVLTDEMITEIQDTLTSNGFQSVLL